MLNWANFARNKTQTKQARPRAATRKGIIHPPDRASLFLCLDIAREGSILNALQLKKSYGFELSKYRIPEYFTPQDWAHNLSLRAFFLVDPKPYDKQNRADIVFELLKNPLKKCALEDYAFSLPVLPMKALQEDNSRLLGSKATFEIDNAGGYFDGRICLAINPRAPESEIINSVLESIKLYKTANDCLPTASGSKSSPYESRISKMIKFDILAYLDLLIINEYGPCLNSVQEPLNQSQIMDILNQSQNRKLINDLKQFAFACLNDDFILWLEAWKSKSCFYK